MPDPDFPQRIVATPTMRQNDRLPHEERKATTPSAGASRPSGKRPSQLHSGRSSGLAAEGGEWDDGSGTVVRLLSGGDNGCF
jgi:hypothetical protein